MEGAGEDGCVEECGSSLEIITPRREGGEVVGLRAWACVSEVGREGEGEGEGRYHET